MADVVREPPPLPEAFYVRAANAWMDVNGDYMDELDDRLRAAVYAAVQLGDHAICWHTTCLGCADRLDGEYGDTVRAEQAEALLDAALAEAEKLRALLDDWHRAARGGNGSVTSGGY